MQKILFILNFPKCILLYALIFLFIFPIAANSDDERLTPYIVHLLNRTSFGPAPGYVEYVQKVGIGEYIREQLHPDKIRIPEKLNKELESLNTLSMTIPQLAEEYLPENKNISKDIKQAKRKDANVIVEELLEAKILRAVKSPAQLQEVMTDFWFNHFNVFSGKDRNYLLVGAYERDAIRPYALGKFNDLLEATAHHPAMLIYLDNWQNEAPKTNKKGTETGINENYAREIMELHTLGVDNGYTQADVTALAHILTGWGLAPGKTNAGKLSFYFNPKRHEWKDKRFLGHLIRANGEKEIQQALDILVHHPATAQHISYKLAQYFIADEPPQPLVSQLAAVFTRTDGNIAAMLDYLFHSPEFWDGQYYDVKFKPPLRYMVSLYRTAHIDPDINFIKNNLNQMGQMPYKFLTPNGYSNTKDNWLNSSALLKRMDIAKTLVKKNNTSDNKLIVNDLLNSYGNNLSKNSMDAIKGLSTEEQLISLFTSPEFLYY